jgi:hypothetical protein
MPRYAGGDTVMKIPTAGGASTSVKHAYRVCPSF